LKKGDITTLTVTIPKIERKSVEGAEVPKGPTPIYWEIYT